MGFDFRTRQKFINKEPIDDYVFMETNPSIIDVEKVRVGVKRG